MKLFSRASGATPFASCLLAVLFALWFWLGSAGQPLVDQHSFRQTQTALTTYYLFTNDTGLLDYQTPVIGSPWSIPFEFPTYQLLVYTVQDLTGIELSTAGRLVSVAFGLANLLLGLLLLRLFAIPTRGQWVFLLLYLSSPIYLYWNRSFMIESTALCFTLASLYLYLLARVRMARDQSLTAIHYVGLLACVVLALLTKATTAIPLVLLMGIEQSLRVGRCMFIAQTSKAPVVRPALTILGILLVAFFTLLAWTSHADALKAQNVIGATLTSGQLQGWNFGKSGQNLFHKLCYEIVYQRVLTPIGAVPVVVLLTIGLLKAPRGTPSHYLILCFLGLFVASLLIFLNVHYVHNYYQAGNQIFLLLALAVAASLPVWQSGLPRQVFFLCLSVTVLGAYWSFFNTYYASSRPATNQPIQVGEFLRANTPAQDGIIVFDADWDSSIAYYAQRRALTYPEWAAKNARLTRADVLAAPGKYLDGLTLGAVVARQPIPQAELLHACRSRAPVPGQQVGDWVVYLCANDRRSQPN